MSFYLALLLGLLSSGHCAGMCGGLIGALSSGSTAPLRSPLNNQLHLLAINLGRISTYVLAGALLGYLGAELGAILDIPLWSSWLRKGMATLMLIIGLQLILQREDLFNFLERLIQPLWKKLQPYWARQLNQYKLGSSYQFGLLWGMLPCGLVYSILLTATSSGSSLAGALTLLGFGLGTLPALLLTGNAFYLYKRAIGKAQLRQASGVILIFSGLFIFAAPLLIQNNTIKIHPLFIGLSHCI